MKKSFITFWKDMWEAQKVTNACMKKHWKGYLVFLTATIVTGFAVPVAITRISDDRIKLKTRKEKSEEEES